MSLSAPLAEPLLDAFVLPNGFRDANTLKLSLVLELNTDHSVFTIDPANNSYLEARARWLGQMSKFYQTLKAYAQDKHLSVLVESLLPLQPVVANTHDTCSIRTAEAEQLFASCVFAPANSRKTTAAAQTAEPPARLSRPPGLNAQATPPTARVNARDDVQQQQAPGPVPVMELLRDIVSNQTSGLTQVPPADQVRVRQAANYVDQANLVRNKLAFSALGGKSASFDAELDPVTKLNGLAAYVRTKIQAMYDATADEPTGVLVAYDLLGNSFGLRRWLGTILDLEVQLPKNFAAGQYTVSVQLAQTAGGEVLSAAEFCRVNPSCFDIGPAGNTPRWVGLAHNSPYLHQGLVDLSQISRIEQIEVEGLLRNADQALETATKQVAYLSPSPEIDLSKLPPPLAFPASDTAPLVEQKDRQSLVAYYTHRAIVRQGTKHILNLHTKGHALYLTKHPDPPTQPDKEGEARARPPDGTSVAAADLVSGYVIYGYRSDASRWQSLCTVREELHAKTTGSLCAWSELVGVALGNGVLVRDENPPHPENALQTLADLFLFVYDGTNLATRHPLRHHDAPLTPPTAPAAAVNQARLQASSLEVARLQAHRQAVDVTQAEITAVRLKTALLFGVDDFPFSTAINRPNLLLRRQPQEVYRCQPSTAKLLFAGAGHTYRYNYLALVQYRNGYVPGQLRVAQGGSQLLSYASPATGFFRQEHLGDVVVSLPRPIYEADGRRPLRHHAGESTRQLVVRTGQLLDNQACERYLLPPISPGFQTLPWSDPTWRQKLGPDAYRWFLRSQCQVESEAAFAANAAVNNERRQMGNQEHPDTGCPAACPGYCGHTRQPDVYDGRLHYLPDPAVTGLHVAFFLDEACLTPADPREYAPLTLRWPTAKQQYPHLQPWRLVLRKDRHPNRLRQAKTSYSTGRHLLVVHLRPGTQLFALVTATYNRADSPFDPENPLFGQKAATKRQQLKTALQHRHAFAPNAANDEEYCVDHLLANSVCLTLTHATQRPLLAPVLQPGSVRLYRAEGQAGVNGQPALRAAEAFAVESRVLFEHLNVPQGCYIAEMPPTGELELFALWNNFTDTAPDPSPSIEQKRDPTSPTKGFLRISTRTFAQSHPEDFLPTLLTNLTGDHQRRCEQLLRFESDPKVPVPHHTDMVLRVRNVSRFQHYFIRDSERDQPGRVALTLSERRELEAQKEPFSLWSAEYRLSDYYLKNPTGYLTPLAEFQANYLPNNAKPQAPIIYKIVPLLVQDDALDATRRALHSRRVRLYMRPDHLTQPGQKSRVAIPVYLPVSTYPTYLQPWLARGGTDAVTDSSDTTARLFTLSAPSGDSYLAPSNFRLDTKELENDYLARFEPLLDDSPAGSALGVVSYVPQFDAGQQLWYVDVQFKLRNQLNTEPHNAFVQLGLASHQPFSANYNSPTDPNVDSPTGFLHDLRLSIPTQVDFFSVLPSRQFTNPYILFLDHQAQHFSLACQLASLFVRESAATCTLATQFLLAVEQRAVGDVWRLVPSALLSHDVRVDNRSLVLPPAPAARFYHPLLPSDLVQQVPTASGQALVECMANLDIQARRGWLLRRAHLRVAVYEVDWHDEQPAGLAELHQQLEALEQAIRPADMPLASPAQILGVLVRHCTVFWEREADNL